MRKDSPEEGNEGNTVLEHYIYTFYLSTTLFCVFRTTIALPILIIDIGKKIIDFTSIMSPLKGLSAPILRWEILTKLKMLVAALKEPLT